MIKQILKKQLDKIKLSDAEYKELTDKAKEFIKKLEAGLKKRKIKADVFLGGSLAKKTIMRKKKYDVDIFVRFDDKYKDEEISNLVEKCLKAERVHGSRDYFRVKESFGVFEIVPVIKISSPSKARNVTDLSYFHVSYVTRAIKKNNKLADEILLAKSFCYANNCYGAESYIKGFSGYALELLIINYKSFLGFLKAVVKSKDKIVLDSGRFYKNKNDILINLNEAKLSSAIIFVDPTNNARNALAALSQETFDRFKIIASSFLKKPSISFFEEKKINEKNYNLILKAGTDKQEGDIAGSKLLKFYNYLTGKIERYFKISRKDFVYSGKTALYYFKIEKRKEIIFGGPRINDVENVNRFRKKHKNVFIKKNQVYAREKVSIDIKDIKNSLSGVLDAQRNPDVAKQRLWTKVRSFHFSDILNSEENKKVRHDMGIIELTV